ncbi:hypothetical protein [Amycolatopsis taiwanensis]|nr:hypothetical protein [Amycolatopsis taiwanensis]
MTTAVGEETMLAKPEAKKSLVSRLVELVKNPKAWIFMIAL